MRLPSPTTQPSSSLYKEYTQPPHQSSRGTGHAPEQRQTLAISGCFFVAYPPTRSPSQPPFTDWLHSPLSHVKRATMEGRASYQSPVHWTRVRAGGVRGSFWLFFPVYPLTTADAATTRPPPSRTAGQAATDGKLRVARLLRDTTHARTHVASTRRRREHAAHTVRGPRTPRRGINNPRSDGQLMTRTSRTSSSSPTDSCL